MEKVEIKYDKKKLLLGFITLTLIIFGAAYMLFFTEIFAKQLLLKIIVILLALFMVYGAYSQIKAVLAKYNVITLTKTYIEINEDGKPQTFLWMEIKELSIEKKRAGKAYIYYLIIKLDTMIREVEITSLDKSIDDIYELIKNYKPRESTAIIKIDKKWWSSL